MIVLAWFFIGYAMGHHGIVSAAVYGPFPHLGACAEAERRYVAQPMRATPGCFHED